MFEFKYLAGDCFYQKEGDYSYFILIISPYSKKEESCYNVLSFAYDGKLLQRIDFCYSRQNDLSKKKYIGNYKHLTAILYHTLHLLDLQLI